MNWALLQGDATRLPLADASVDLVFGSPPYMDARTYGIGAQRGCTDWIQWMLGVVRECCRVSKGLVLINCAGVTRDRCYWPGCEGLLYEWWKQGGQCWRPVYWNRVGIPGSGGKQWLRADVEYVLAFKRDAEWLPWADNTACGHPPKWAPGGKMSNRLSDGARVNQWGHPIASGGTAGGIDDVTCAPPRPSHRLAGEVWGGGATSFGRRANGTKIPPAVVSEDLGNHNGNNRLHRGNPKGRVLTKVQTRRKPNGDRARDGVYEMPVMANPGNMLKVIVGGGVMGSKLAHENEAPFPEALAEFFIKSWCPPGGKCLDPFSGSGTTVSVARRLGRIGIGSDLRFNQCELGRRRVIEQLTAKVKVKRPKRVKESADQSSLFAA